MKPTYAPAARHTCDKCREVFPSGFYLERSQDGQFLCAKCRDAQLHQATTSGVEPVIDEHRNDGGAAVGQTAQPKPRSSPSGRMSKDSIHSAAQFGDLEQVKALVKDKPDLVFKSSRNSMTSYGTPLHEAARYGHKTVVEFLLDSKAEVNAPVGNEKTPLHMAAGNGHKDVAELLLSSGADVNAKDGDGKTALHMAAENGFENVVRLLVAKRANVNARSKKGETPFVLATKNGYKGIADFLSANGADSTLKSFSRLPSVLVGVSVAFVIFVSGQYFSFNAALIGAIFAIVGGWFWQDLGFLPLDVVDQSGRLLLLDAIRDGRTDTVAGLLDNNAAEVNEKFHLGRTPLHMSASFGRKDIAELLLNKGADINARDNEGTTPILDAAWKGHRDVLELLLMRNADVNVKSNNGVTPLHSAAVAGHGDIVALLLSNGADVNARTNKGRTPLKLAMLKKHKDIAESLHRHGGIE